MMPSMRGLFVLALLVSTIVLGTTASSSQALAQDVRTIGKFRDWTAYTYDEGGSKVCYIASRPQKDQGNYTRRGDIFAIVSHRPAEGASNVVSFVAGYPYKEQSEVSVTVDGRNAFTLFTHDETAWAYDEDDAKLVTAMKAGSEMVVVGTSSRGTRTTDTYSLMGFTNAHEAITGECQ
ncbi:invasion associated locus B family protein [Rhodospira trueperi]|uniref:Invasion associated locus B (IalB) protein n=1 Tax=Rhodospira trueperi TaxID=69960 RepID=A0A1G7G037_9PROT|nr:invasion associated locus B family protein [Rhodospira trueperi]SDE81504.1 Invasion associated locus B (IalB) protein [Rhodospira trueperi]